MKRIIVCQLFPLALLAVLLGGCINLKPVADPTKFYLLSVRPAPEPLPEASKLTLPICVAKVETPAYLDNPSLAVRQNGNVITYAQYHQWAEPVHLGVTRSLSEHLAGLLGASRVNPANRRYPSGDCLEVQAVLSQFEITATGQALLAARWRILHTGTGAVLHAGLSKLTSGQPQAPLDYSASVQALSETIALWSQQVAQAIITNSP